METSTRPAAQPDDVLPFERSVGYQVRMTHRLLQRYLQQQIEPHGVTPGMWYFLRALWHEDGLTQRQLSEIVGTMEPTTLMAIRSMERKGLVKRVRSDLDKRKINIHLTPRGLALRDILLPLARKVVDKAVEGFSERETVALLQYLDVIQQNMRKSIDDTPPQEG
ncbi:MAG: MarR family winged helix-turn-helix transcriptional regulator [Rhizobiaceae bacterium]|nr:MarR family winged helix-turn-helix transcriptional regulator [Rhizobiaceae bacterium]MCV0407106.1 MarR family winged helix-turn-helix transcriptional regulator [Rhizobiaceae bacterium]